MTAEVQRRMLAVSSTPDGNLFCVVQVPAET